MNAPLRWPAEAVWEQVAPRLPGFTVEVLPSVDSTNSELMRRCRAAAQDPLGATPPESVLLVAEQQTAGRGRKGRAWQSLRGDSLTFSLGLPLQPVDWSGLSLVVGVSLADSLEPIQENSASPTSSTAPVPALQLKWPNDLWLHGRKLGGILVETASWGGQRYVVVGAGLNVRMPPDLTRSGLPNVVAGTAAVPPTCLHALWPSLDAPAALLAVAKPLVEALLQFEQQGFAAFAARFARRDALAGRPVRLSDGSEGTAEGTAPDGALLVRTTHGLQRVSSDEVSVRPWPG
jgi:BirA family biotin operon repressor/biotin-[acetyl-CoA-carboxylase] ligase